jgi:hypothetical protein
MQPWDDVAAMLPEANTQRWLRDNCAIDAT